MNDFKINDVHLCSLSVKPNSIKYSEFLLPFGLLFRDVKRKNLCTEDLRLMKARLLDKAWSSCESFPNDQDPSENLTTLEFKPLRHLSKHKNILPLDKTIDICTDSLYNSNENTPKIPKDVFCNLVDVAPK